MIKKKRFGISSELSRGFSETINAVENHEGTFRNALVPISRLELDPANPRDLILSFDDIRTGLDKNDEQFPRKQQELDSIRSLAYTIQKNGLINPIVVYKNGDCYRVVAGERRSLASLFAGKSEIDARVFNEKPKAFELKLIQWIENTEREDLSLHERLGNIRDIIQEYRYQHPDKEVASTQLSAMTGMSLSQASYYFTVLNAQKDLLDLIQAGHINSLDKAAMIAHTESPVLREQLMKQCLDGTSLKDMRKIVADAKQTEHSAKRGRKTTRINLGFTSNPKVIQHLVNTMLSQEVFENHVTQFRKVNWSQIKEAARGFKSLIAILEHHLERKPQ